MAGLRELAGPGTHDIVLGLLDTRPRQRIIDAGPGEGALTQRLLERGHQVTAVGFYAAQFRFDTQVFVQHDLDTGLPFAEGSVDAVVAVEVIEHLEAPLLFIREAARCLTDGGYLILSTPNVLSWASRLSYLFRGVPIEFATRDYVGNGHISPITKRQLLSMSTRVGFTLETETYNIGKIPIPKLRHMLHLRRPIFRTGALGENMILKLRKRAASAEPFHRG